MTGYPKESEAQFRTVRIIQQDLFLTEVEQESYLLRYTLGADEVGALAG